MIATPPRQAVGLRLMHLALGSDHRLRKHTLFVVATLYFYLILMGVAWHAAHLGVFERASSQCLMLALALTWSCVYALVRSGLTSAMADPSITLVHGILAQILNVVTFLTIGPLRGDILLPLAIGLVFPMFRLRPAQIVGLTALVILEMTVGVFWLHWQDPAGFPVPAAWLSFGLMIACLPANAWVAATVGALRLRLIKQRRQLKETLKQVERLATRDTLTGLYNRGHMEALIAAAVERADIAREECCVALLDIDFFKSINDVYGHQRGDLVLQGLSKLIAERLRPTDSVARWGGEEFLILFEDTSIEDAYNIVESLRYALAVQRLIPEIQDLTVTFSAGLAQVGALEPIDMAVERADRALYLAKGRGRNNCVRAAKGNSHPLRRGAESYEGRQTSVDLPQRISIATPANQNSIQKGATASHLESSLNLRKDRMQVADWLLGSDRLMRLRLRGILMVIVVYGICCAEAFYVSHYGMAKPDFAFRLIPPLLVFQLMVFAAVRSGWSLRFKDPNLTFAQSLFALAAIAYTYTQLAPAYRGVCLVIIVTVVVFGMYSLTPRQARVISLAAVLFVGGMSLVMSRIESAYFPWHLEILHIELLAGTLPALTLSANLIAQFRQTVTRERRALRLAVERMQVLATRDALTGLINRRQMQELLDEACRHLAQSGQAFSIALIDLDHFKRINDTYGHRTGDEVLQRFASVAVQTLRDMDVIARWGGEEFLILFRDSDSSEAQFGLQRLADSLVDQQMVADVPQLRVSFSAGVATHRAGNSQELTLERADRALYRAKAEGRCRTLVGTTTITMATT